MSRTLLRGDVVWVALDPARGTEIRRTRPAIVISNDSCNRHGSRVVVLPVTSNVSSLYPGEARIDLAGKPARVLGDQIRSVDKERIRSRIGDYARTSYGRSKTLSRSLWACGLEGRAAYEVVTFRLRSVICLK